MRPRLMPPPIGMLAATRGHYSDHDCTGRRACVGGGSSACYLSDEWRPENRFGLNLSVLKP
jgi:hypothetical protein